MEPDTEQIESIPQANTQLTAQIDGMVHTTRVEILTALVETGTYQVDSQAIAQHILAKPLMRNLLKRV